MIVAHMLIRNVADIITETLTEIARWGIERIVILDGGSDDGTIELIQAFHGMEVDLHVKPDPDDNFADHRREELLELTRKHKPDWILSVDTDEIYHTDPVTAICVAEDAGANVIWCDVPQFWITIADIKAGLLLENESVSVQERRRWYSWGHTGVFIWKDHPKHFYPRDVQKRTPEFRGVLNYRQWQRPGSVRPICKHYPFRSLRQAMKRAEERQRRGGRYYFGKYYYDWIIDEQVVGLHYFDGQWCKKSNHDAVYAYMGRLKK